MILKRYADLTFGDWVQQTHYRVAGEGSALILLHPSPMSSAFMQPLIELFEKQARVYAPDTPGYGQSDPLPEPAGNLAAYVDWLHRFMRAVGLTSAGFYGSATGAQIALEFGKAHPDMTEFVVLDNAVHFTQEERTRFLRDYFPDLSPRADGSHLQQAWDIASSLYQFFPWFDRSEQARVSAEPPDVDLVHATVLAYLEAGPDYDRAYRAAFANEDARRLQALTRPARIIRWQGSMLRNYAARLDEFDWPENIRMVHCKESVQDRYRALEETVAELMG